MGLLETIIKPIAKIFQQKSEKIQIIDTRNEGGGISASQYI